MILYLLIFLAHILFFIRTHQYFYASGNSIFGVAILMLYIGLIVTSIIFVVRKDYRLFPLVFGFSPIILAFSHKLYIQRYINSFTQNPNACIARNASVESEIFMIRETGKFIKTRGGWFVKEYTYGKFRMTKDSVIFYPDDPESFSSPLRFAQEGNDLISVYGDQTFSLTCDSNNNQSFPFNL